MQFFALFLLEHVRPILDNWITVHETFTWLLMKSVPRNSLGFGASVVDIRLTREVHCVTVLKLKVPLLSYVVF
jgi:hypothetical protein